MKYIIDYEIDDAIFDDEIHYFFTLLDSRYDPVNNMLKTNLEKEFKKIFEPIYIQQTEFNNAFIKKNYIILNSFLVNLRKEKKDNALVCMEDIEDVNAEFCKSLFIQDILNKLLKKQDQIFIMSFTSHGLSFNDKKIINIGPNHELVETYDNKITQIKLFERLNLQTPDASIYDNIDSVLSQKQLPYPFFISASYTSGGSENGIINCKNDLVYFKQQLRAINLNREVYITHYIQDVKCSPNVTAMVCGENDVMVLLISDQILEHNKHLGNIYPSKVNSKNKEVIFDITTTIGNHLSNKGFRGLFGCDFIIDNNNDCLVIEINPRRQAGYLMLLLMSRNVNILEAEIKLALGKEIDQFTYEDIQVDFAWAYSKIKPLLNNHKIKNEIKEGTQNDLFVKVGESFKHSYFPKNYIASGNFIGYTGISGEKYDDIQDQLLAQMMKLQEEI